MRRTRAAGLAVIAVAAVALAVPWPPAAVEAAFSSALYPAWQRIATTATNALPFAAFDLVLAAAILGLVGLAIGVVARERGRAVAARRRGAPGRARRRRGHLPLVPRLVGLQLSADAGRRPRRPRSDARDAGAAVRLRPRHRRRSEPSAAHRARTAVAGSRGPGRDAAAGLPRRRCLASASARTSCPACRSGRCCSPTSAGRGSTASPTRSCRRSSSTTICCRWNGPSRSRTSGDTWPVSPTKPRRATPAGSPVRPAPTRRGTAPPCGRSGTSSRRARASSRVLLLSRLGDGPRSDLRAIAMRTSRRVRVVQQVSWATYDRYLKSNRVSEGLASYDGAIVLILAGLPESRHDSR